MADPKKAVPPVPWLQDLHTKLKELGPGEWVATVALSSGRRISTMLRSDEMGRFDQENLKRKFGGTGKHGRGRAFSGVCTAWRRRAAACSSRTRFPFICAREPQCRHGSDSYRTTKFVGFLATSQEKRFVFSAKKGVGLGRTMAGYGKAPNRLSALGKHPKKRFGVSAQKGIGLDAPRPVMAKPQTGFQPYANTQKSALSSLQRRALGSSQTGFQPSRY